MISNANTNNALVVESLLVILILLICLKKNKKHLYYEFQTNFDIDDFVLDEIKHKYCLDKCIFKHDVSFYFVKNSIEYVKTDKSDQSFDIYSSYFIKGSDKLFLHLANIFKLYISYGVTSDKLSEYMFLSQYPYTGSCS